MRCPACRNPNGTLEPEVGAIRCERCGVWTFVDASGAPEGGAAKRAFGALLAQARRERPSRSLRARFARGVLERGGVGGDGAVARGIALLERLDDWSLGVEEGPLRVRSERERPGGGAYRGAARPRVVARRVEWKPTAVPTYASLFVYGIWMAAMGWNDPDRAGLVGGVVLFGAALALFVRARRARRVEVRDGRVIVRVGGRERRWALDDLAWVTAGRSADDRGWGVRACVGDEVQTLVDGLPSEAAARQVVALLEEGLEPPPRYRVAMEEADRADEEERVADRPEPRRRAKPRRA